MRSLLWRRRGLPWDREAISAAPSPAAPSSRRAAACNKRLAIPLLAVAVLFLVNLSLHASFGPLEPGVTFTNSAGLLRLSPDDGSSYMFGYFDKQQVDAANVRVIVCKIPFFNEEPLANSVMTVGLVNLSGSGLFQAVGTTTAWNLQQGAMAEWIGPESIIFNVRSNSTTTGFAARVVHVVTGEVKDIPRPVYAFNPARKVIVSLSFSRLHKLRRGYGYTVPRVAPKERYPSDDGLWIVNLSSFEERLAVSIGEVRSYVLSTAGKVDQYTGHSYVSAPPESSNYYWWVNHAMFSPDGSQLAFLVRANGHAPSEYASFSTLLVYDVGLQALWRVPRVSGSHHFFGTFLLSCDGGGTFEIRFRKSVTQLPWQRGVDGHCSLSPGERWILTDTYPDEYENKHLYVEERRGATRYDLGSFRASEKGPVEARCDLHPRWDRSGNFVLFDSTHESTRAVYRKEVFPAPAPGEGQDGGPSLVSGPSTDRFASPAWLSTCTSIYLDVGTNIGVQIRKFFEPSKYRGAPVLAFFDRHFGGALLRRRPGAESGICVLGMEPSPQLQPRLEKLEKAYQQRGWHVHIFPFAAYVREAKLDFELRDGVGHGTASSLDPMLPKTYGEIRGHANVRAVDLASFIKMLPVGSIKLMKLDIEGSEYKVVPHLAKSGSICRDVVAEAFIEIHKRPGETSIGPGTAVITAELAQARSANGLCPPTKLAVLDDESYPMDVDDDFSR